MGPDLGIRYSNSALLQDGKVAAVTLKTNIQDYETIKSLLITRHGPPTKTSMSVVKTMAGGEFSSEESDWSGVNVAISLFQRYEKIDESEVFVQYKSLMKAFVDEKRARENAAASKL